MSNQVDIVKAAQERQYTKFEEMAREMLMTKVGENPTMKSNWNKLQDIKEAFEKKDDKSKNSKDSDDEDDEDEDNEDEDDDEDEDED